MRRDITLAGLLVHPTDRDLKLGSQFFGIEKGRGIAVAIHRHLNFLADNLPNLLEEWLKGVWLTHLRSCSFTVKSPGICATALESHGHPAPARPLIAQRRAQAGIQRQ